jgi:hypothetical protein
MRGICEQNVNEPKGIVNILKKERNPRRNVSVDWKMCVKEGWIPAGWKIR